MFEKIYNEVSVDFGAKIAIGLLQLMAIAGTTKYHKLPARKYVKKFRQWTNLNRDEQDLVVSLYDLVYDWEIKDSCHGLGGCERKTFKELLEAQDVSV